jgi:glycosyltransferase involved in cell wall biosynthesis
MRLLFFDPSYYWSGRGRAFLAGARAMSQRGHDVTCACPRHSTFERKARVSGLANYAVSSSAILWGRSRALARALQEHFIDVIFVHDERDDLAASLAVRLTQRGAVVRRLGAGERPRLGRRTQWARRLAPVTYLLTGTPATDFPLPVDASIVEGAVGIDVAPAAPEQPLPERNRRGTPYLACLVGRGAHRRVFDVLRAIALLSERLPGVRLALAGVAPNVDECRLHAAALNLARRIDFFTDGAEEEAVRRAELAWVIGDGDDAAFGCLTAMAHGVPVLAQRGVVTERFVTSGVHGDLFPELHPHLMAATVADYAERPSRRASMARRARERVEREFSQREMADGFEEAARTAGEYLNVDRAGDGAEPAAS